MRNGFLIFIGLCLGVAFGQREATLYSLENVYQASYVNPTARPTSKVSLSFYPNVYYGIALPVSGKEVIENDQLSATKLINNIDKGFWNLTFVNADILGVRFKAKKWFWNASLRARSFSKLMIDKDMLELAWDGNASKLGEDIKLNHMGNHGTAYTEIGIGGARDFGDKWRLGAKVKLNLGVANVSNTKTDASLYFDPITYEARMDGKYTINTASIPNIDDDQGWENLEIQDYLNPNFKNWGLGIDLGAEYKFDDRLSFSASIVDLGFIKWTDNTQNYNLEVDGVVQGVDAMSAILRGGDVDSVFNQWVDDLEEQGDYTVTNENYTTMTHGQFYLNGKYKLTQSANVYGRMNMFLWKGLRTSFTLGVSQELGRFLQFTVNNTIQYNRLFNVGVGFVVKPGPFQIFLSADNILAGVWDVYDNIDAPIPRSMTNANFRFGINLVFGKIQAEDKIY